MSSSSELYIPASWAEDVANVTDEEAEEYFYYLIKKYNLVEEVKKLIEKLNKSTLKEDTSELEIEFEPRTINIVDELNKIDSEDYQDLVNMYNAIILTPSEKESLVVCIKNNDKQGIIDFINKAYSEQVLDEPFEIETEVTEETPEDKKYVIKASDDGIDIIRVDGADTIEEAGEKALDATSLHSYVAVFDTETGEKVFGSDKIGD